MNIFMQGMRRSGTTVVYDLLLEDGRFDCFYEPLAAAKATSGGGSGAHDLDLFEPVRRKRSEFLAGWSERVDPELLNYGAPRDAAVEFDPHLPEPVRAYLESLIVGPRPCAIKFTRMAAKIAVLHDLDPDATVLHLLRDPRAIAASYLFGKNERNRRRFADETEFFTRTSTASAWSSRPFTDLLLARPENVELGELSDVMRILLLWKHNFRITHDAGHRLFGERYRILRHEELRSTPQQFIDGLYGFLGTSAPSHVHDWARANLRPASAPFAADDSRWSDAFGELDMRAELLAAGYPSCVE